MVNNPERLKSHLTKCTADGQPQSKKMVQSVLSTVNPTKQHGVDMQVLRYLIASNTPFLQAEKKEFVKMHAEHAATRNESPMPTNAGWTIIGSVIRTGEEQDN